MQYQDQLYIGTFYRYWYVVALCYENITITISPSRYPPTRSLYAPEFVSLVIIFRKINRVYLIIGLRVYVTVCFSAVVGACVRYGVLPKRGGASDFLSGWSRPTMYTCCMFCERKFSANTILRLSKMSAHAEFPRESQFY
jgi:hypothetical protein